MRDLKTLNCYLRTPYYHPGPTAGAMRLASFPQFVSHPLFFSPVTCSFIHTRSVCNFLEEPGQDRAQEVRKILRLGARVFPSGGRLTTAWRCRRHKSNLASKNFEKSAVIDEFRFVYTRYFYRRELHGFVLILGGRLDWGMAEIGGPVYRPPARRSLWGALVPWGTGARCRMRSRQQGRFFPAASDIPRAV